MNHALFRTRLFVIALHVLDTLCCKTNSVIDHGTKKCLLTMNRHYVFFYYCHSNYYCSYFVGSSSFDGFGTADWPGSNGHFALCNWLVLGHKKIEKNSGILLVKKETFSPRKHFTTVTGWTKS